MPDHFPHLTRQADVWSEGRRILDESIGAYLQTRKRGFVFEAVGMIAKASGLLASVGDLCHVYSTAGSGEVAVGTGEVVGFTGDATLIMLHQGIAGLRRNCEIGGSGSALSVGVGTELLGRVLDGMGEPIDGKGPLVTAERRPVFVPAPQPMARDPIHLPFQTSIKAIDAFATMGRGQRLGVFAPAGAGKSTLIGMLARGANADLNVIALIGERGREVMEFIEQSLGESGMARSVVICSTSDRSPLERSRCAFVAMTIAEYMRDRGADVLLVMDSLTRFARAQREIGLAVGEPPTRRGYPPSLFQELPRLLERAGNANGGTITSLFTVLEEGSDDSDPVGEEVRSLIDGHIILSKDLAAKGQYPPIDIKRSLSRVMNMVTTREHQRVATRLKSFLAKYEEIEFLLQVGEYREGVDPLADAACEHQGQVVEFLKQSSDEIVPLEASLEWISGWAEV